jgi:integrase
MSSLFTFLLRRYPDLFSINPFRGSKFVKKVVKKLTEKEFPTDKEVVSLQRVMTGLPSLLLNLLIDNGLRLGGALNMVVNDNKTFSTFTKGKNYYSVLTDDTFKLLKSLQRKGLIKDYHKPFSGISSKTLRNNFTKQQQRLVDKRIISQVFTPHKFRSYYASKLYLATKDLYLIKKKLNHNSITSTEIYLQGLGVLVS